ncbi:DUF4439 domain-containing protein [Actinobacteria bacterium YIM 96077]|uniref:DUF4439 domain-containing protein n=1 Tax=Phytoactinopolyspora halophila TaxID=1981511 RepID=A0A329QYN7_9ACTN|nr:ferritin-like domain-containing protein [Phytoactinopolyspora halophila]AYY12775.1 DUF4439 domain-containing protein [Actinobacteria bacterium YIM 96077]RAW16432.1 DUF4439 domain-containing protein [Phytoactinopolyspora halophila]
MNRSVRFPTSDVSDDATPPDDVVAALQATLAGEHACVYGYGVAGAYLDDDELAAARQALEVHEQRRDTLREHLLAMDVEPEAALPAYALPFAVDDATSARELAGVLEERLGAVYIDLIGAGTGVDLRELAAEAVVDTAVRAARWGVALSAFPGLEGREGAPDAAGE